MPDALEGCFAGFCSGVSKIWTPKALILKPFKWNLWISTPSFSPSSDLHGLGPIPRDLLICFPLHFGALQQDEGPGTTRATRVKWHQLPSTSRSSRRHVLIWWWASSHTEQAQLQTTQSSNLLQDWHDYVLLKNNDIETQLSHTDLSQSVNISVKKDWSPQPVNLASPRMRAKTRMAPFMSSVCLEDQPMTRFGLRLWPHYMSS